MSDFIGKPITFFLLTFLYSWIFWIFSIVLSINNLYLLSTFFFYIGGIGPSLIGILLLYFRKTKEEISNFWKRSRNFVDIKFNWYIIIILFTFGVNLLSIGLSLLIAGYGTTFDIGLLSDVSIFLPYLLFLVLGVLAEEFGWRGYSLDALQEKRSSLSSSLIIGVFWAVWHLPLFFLEGRYQYSLGIGTLDFWLFFIALIPDSIIYTWIYSNTKRSILSAILYHFATNFFGEIFVSLSGYIQLIRVIILFIITIFIILMSKAFKKKNR
jgi:membrane protease YdiL (CAAX protease family)